MKNEQDFFFSTIILKLFDSFVKCWKWSSTVAKVFGADADGRLEEDSAVGLNFESSRNCSDAGWFFWGKMVLRACGRPRSGTAEVVAQRQQGKINTESTNLLKSCNNGTFLFVFIEACKYSTPNSIEIWFIFSDVIFWSAQNNPPDPIPPLSASSVKKEPSWKTLTDPITFPKTHRRRFVQDKKQNFTTLVLPHWPALSRHRCPAFFYKARN